MSKKELDRLPIIKAVADKGLSQGEAARRLDLSVRQVKRLVRGYRREGAAALASRRRGKPANNAIADAVRQQALALVRERYADFGPTLACEKLAERHGCRVSAETLRQWLIAEGVWSPKPRREARVHPPRPRRPRRGELVQIDGSPHDWFEGRHPPCALIVFIDDASSELMALRFVPAETTEAYMETLDGYLARHGRPVAFYSDKFSVFRVNQPDCEGELTQFGRALKTLGIESIHARTPQAKGRVERANKTLQDRLVKEMRLEGIDDMAAANAFLPRFMEGHNARFAVAPADPADAHRKVLHTPQELAWILSLQHTRKLSKNLTCQFKNRLYHAQAKGKGYGLRHAEITVCEAFGGGVTFLRKGKPLECRLLAEGESPPPVEDGKSVGAAVDRAKREQARKPQWKPPADHAWRRAIAADVQRRSG